MNLRTGHCYEIGDTGRRAIVFGKIAHPALGPLVRVRAEDEFGGWYFEYYRPDGRWPFNALGNFDLREIRRSKP